MLFYLASIIIHDCFHTSHTDFAISETSSYLDLAPLYGSNAEQQMSVRAKKDGMLKPDCFEDKRIHGFPPGVGLLLIMFNRFHNHVVKNLAKIDENQRFSVLLQDHGGFKGIGSQQDKTSPSPEERYDEALFQTARLVTTGLYINIVLKDYVRTILGLNRTNTLWNLDPRSDEGKAFFGAKIPEATGNQVAAEFNLVYRWHSCVSERDTEWTEEAMTTIANNRKDLNMKELIGALEEWHAKIPKDPQERPFEKLKRQSDGRFSDDELASIWISSVEDVAGAYGAAHVPPVLKSVEVLGIMQARSWNLASLNEFRAYFQLKPHETFESINPDPHIADQLSRLYGHPDNVEIYPGIVVEAAKKTMKPGSGLAASFTTSRAILADAVSLVRSDRFYTVDSTPQNLTNWGYRACGYDLDINHGCVFYKLILNALPNDFSKNSIYVHYPLVIPAENQVILRELKRDSLYSFICPTSKPPALFKPSAGLASTAMADSSQFDSPWSSRARAFGGPTGKAAASASSFADAFMADDKWKGIVTKYYTETLERLWIEKQYQLGGQQQIDLVDVLNSAHIGFITSILGIPMGSQQRGAKPDKHSLLSIFGEMFEQAFGNPQPNSLNAKVRDATRWLASTIEAQIDGSSNKPETREGEIGQDAYAKLASSDIGAREAAWKDVLPTAALILNTLSRLSAQTVDFFLENAEDLAASTNGNSSTKDTEFSLDRLAQEATRISSSVTIAKRALTEVNDAKEESAQKGQVVVVNLSKATNDASSPETFRLDRDESVYSMKSFGPEVDLAYKVTYICNTVTTGIMRRHPGIQRVPGPQGVLKKVHDEAGNVTYMNAEESEYVPYPMSMKVRWKAAE